ncbi:Protein phosphatase methylesterase 1 [Coccomyxa sp. Obi]|nr:Protein phosphatase methylesterase 1 [Coccomyxa sp. Obi]
MTSMQGVPSDSLFGPLSTIPDGVSCSGQGADELDGIPANIRQDVEPEVGSWDQYFDEKRDIQLEERGGTFRVYMAGSKGAVIYCLHGCGYTGLTWALIAAAVKDRYRLVALDMRGHGETITHDDLDLSSTTLSQDAVAVWEALLGEEKAPTVIVGHSMGGAIATWSATLQAIPSLEGLVVIDVVEGTALASLPHMSAILSNRPPSFPSLQVAFEWARHSGTCKNSEAATVSLPSMLRKEVAVDRGRWVWRTPLEKSQPFWQGWYEGLSDAFLGVKVPKVLMLAGTDRLDRTLTIGQMQGRFQLVLLPQAGHAIHEDEPARTAEVLLNFLQRFRVGEPKVPIPRPANAGIALPIAAGPAYSQAPDKPR